MPAFSRPAFSCPAFSRNPCTTDVDCSWMFSCTLCSSVDSVSAACCAPGQRQVQQRPTQLHVYDQRPVLVQCVGGNPGRRQYSSTSRLPNCRRRWADENDGQHERDDDLVRWVPAALPCRPGRHRWADERAGVPRPGPVSDIVHRVPLPRHQRPAYSLVGLPQFQLDNRLQQNRPFQVRRRRRTDGRQRVLERINVRSNHLGDWQLLRVHQWRHAAQQSARHDPSAQRCRRVRRLSLSDQRRRRWDSGSRRSDLPDAGRQTEGDWRAQHGRLQWTSRASRIVLRLPRRLMIRVQTHWTDRRPNVSSVNTAINIRNSLPLTVDYSTLRSFRRTIQRVDRSSFLKCS